MIDGESGRILYLASIWVLPALFAITLHEVAHGYTAYLLGDDTAKKRGRLSLNPLRHIDPMGTVLIPAMLIFLKAPFLFGYAKPVPVAFGRLRRPRRDMVFVAAAGPGTNVALAVLSAILLNISWFLPDEFGRWWAANCWNSVVLNLVLAIFNMLPLPPLDGGKVAVGLLPEPIAVPLARMERYGFLILLAVIILPAMMAGSLGLEINVFSWLVITPLEWMLPLFQKIAFLAR